jgi:acetyl esterase
MPNKQTKKAIGLQKLMSLYTKKAARKANKHSRERFVATSYGEVRVREYGFEIDDITPLFINMHGGGFVVGCPELDDFMCRFFKEKTGVKIISIDYPKAPANPFPIGVNACYEVIKHYIDNSTEYGIDKNRVGIGGHSAGGNFAVVICMMAKEKSDFSLRYQILDYPPLDLSIDPYEKPNPPKAIPPKMADMFNRCYLENYPENADHPYVSPNHASREQLTGLPPALLIICGLDSLHDEGLVFYGKLKDAGVEVEFHDFKDSAHGFTGNKTPDALKAHTIMADFMNKYKGG